MSYDDSNSTPGDDTWGRVGSTIEEEEEAGTGLNSPGSNNNHGSQSGTSDLANRVRGSSPSGSGSGGSSGGDQRGPSSDDGERESSEGGGGSRGHQSRSSHCSSSQKDSGMMLENTESNKSSQSQSQSPPSSSLAYSLLSVSSEQDPPSTSGCSSNEQHQTARVQTQKEMLKALKELKVRLPAECKGKGRSSTLDALQYALNCVKQVRANQEYYHQWGVEECHGCSLDLSVYTTEELDNIASEYTLKNTDTFSMAVSFLTGKVVYISPQGSSLLRCKPERLQGAIFSELLAPQDVSTFYSSTAPCHLPAWATCMGSVSPLTDCTQGKSMFCRISADRAQGGEIKYYPFRMTPYQLTLRDLDTADPQPCCLLIAERVQSGYEAPRIPADKRIFSTSHTPSCLFQEVDERAVPLLGYLPQDLVGSPVLLYLHPEDRPIMVAIHRKILQSAGQPFDSSPMRMCARSGEYVTIDTSWSSFINPWSRKVAFIVGRHKVRTSPLNEDVFTPLRGCEGRPVAPEIVQLSEQIHRLLVKPVHSGGSQGYSSLASNGSCSHEQQYRRTASSASDSKSTNAMEAMEAAVVALHKPMTFQQICKDVYMVKTSGQQVFINSHNRALSRRHAVTALRATGEVEPIKSLIPEVACPSKPLVFNTQQLMKEEPPSAYSYQQINCLDSIIRFLDGCNVKRKFGSSSATSASDEEKQQETAGNEKDVVMENAPPTPTPATPTTTRSPPTAIINPPPPKTTSPSSRRGGGLTKEVLSAHTQQEEQAFLCRFSDLSQLRVISPSSALRCPLPNTNPRRRRACSPDYPAAEGSSGRRGAKRLKKQESSEQRGPLALGLTGPLRSPNVVPMNSPPSSTYTIPVMPLGPPTTSSWPVSVGSQASLPSVPYPSGTLPLYPIYPPLSQPIQNQMVPPMMALVLPNYMFPQLHPNLSQMTTAMNTMGSLTPQPGAAMVTPGPQQFFNPGAGFPFPGTNVMPCPMPTMPSLMQTAMPIQTQRPASGSSTPQSYSQVPVDQDCAESPLFHSRCSSPLNLLQLVEESPSNRLEVATALAASAQQATIPSQGTRGRSPDDSKENANDSNQDGESTPSDLLDLLLQEDSRSGSASSGSGSDSLGTVSNGCSSSGSGTSRSRSSRTSKYFGSIDSSENDHCRKQPAGGSRAGGDGEEQLIKCVLQDPIWLLMANTDHKVMMTYQLPTKDRETVLRQDREALRAMHKHQPRFTEDQKRELSQVHPWIRTGRLPRAINISACMGCKSSPLPESTVDQGGEARREEGHAAHSETQGNDQEMTTEEQEVTWPTGEKKARAGETYMTH
uniref:period circadian protein homolog 1b isoform X3 n=1 Tax=Oncorhynchus gorbuscha TaxID=8017 RepID=UPI001EAF7E0D|nr:period circadian protein homolog 1b isoform X3 [Oncorhynchus gorbuscha]